MTRNLKVISAGLLLCALSWNGEALGQELALATTDSVDMKVSVSCKDGDATFTVTNNGEAWPSMGSLSVYSIGTNKLIHNRRMRFGKGQRATFRVSGAAYDNPEFGLWFEPSWFKRDFKYDSKITCS